MTIHILPGKLRFTAARELKPGSLFLDEGLVCIASAKRNGDRPGQIPLGERAGERRFLQTERRNSEVLLLDRDAIELTLRDLPVSRHPRDWSIGSVAILSEGASLVAFEKDSWGDITRYAIDLMTGFYVDADDVGRGKPTFGDWSIDVKLGDRWSELLAHNVNSPG